MMCAQNRSAEMHTKKGQNRGCQKGAFLEGLAEREKKSSGGFESILETSLFDFNVWFGLSVSQFIVLVISDLFNRSIKLSVLWDVQKYQFYRAL